MPTWRNDNAKSTFFVGKLRAVGEVFTTTTYPYPRPVGFTLIAHTPRKHDPWEKLHAGTLPVAIDDGIAKFAQIEIINKSGNIITMEANEDADNARIIPDGEFRIIEQDHEIDALSVTGDGAGSVYVYGMRIQ